MSDNRPLQHFTMAGFVYLPTPCTKVLYYHDTSFV